MASLNSLPGMSGASPPNPSQREDPTLATSTSDLRIVTSLMYHYFNENDSSEKQPSKAETYNLITRWKELSRRLSELHVQRLRDAAEAVGWGSIPGTHPSLSKHENHNQSRALSDHEQQVSQPDLHLPSLLDQAAIRHATDAKLPPPSQGTMRSHKVRILVSRSGDIDVEFASQSASSDVTHSLSAIADNYASCPFTLDIGDRTTSLVTVDAGPTKPSLVTRHKTTLRDPYDTARARAVPPIPPTALPTEREVLLFNSQDELMEASVSSVYFHRQGTWLTPSSESGGMQSVTKMYALQKGWCVEGVIGKDTVTNGEIVWLGNAVRGFFAGKILI